MNPLLSTISRYFRRPRPVGHRKTRRPRLCLEVLERRDVPSALSVADVTVREGPTSTGILDPAGAAGVGINGIRGITFDRLRYAIRSDAAILEKTRHQAPSPGPGACRFIR